MHACTHCRCGVACSSVNGTSQRYLNCARWKLWSSCRLTTCGGERQRASGSRPTACTRWTCTSASSAASRCQPVLSCGLRLVQAWAQPQRLALVPRLCRRLRHVDCCPSAAPWWCLSWLRLRLVWRRHAGERGPAHTGRAQASSTRSVPVSGEVVAGRLRCIFLRGLALGA